MISKLGRSFAAKVSLAPHARRATRIGWLHAQQDGMRTRVGVHAWPQEVIWGIVRRCELVVATLELTYDFLIRY